MRKVTYWYRSGAHVSGEEQDVFPSMTCNHRHWSKGIESYPNEGPPMLKSARVIENIKILQRMGLLNVCKCRDIWSRPGFYDGFYYDRRTIVETRCIYDGTIVEPSYILNP
ncbi:hypothetical protein F511_05289 [Dorcoceras hygrometricum]|uniref:Uncharacterized protein n=1 Tax=Dorcoceras hygrometricum TaxID=472368 RepID=A0A2Z7AKH3_9LAMI|nr:hypothetical protein F511_05289 [Dorcoceras hygrometricum]